MGPLWTILKVSMESGVVPLDWRSAMVTPIYKSGRKSDMPNYCPVTLTSVLCKVMEKLIRIRLMEHLESGQLLPSQQHGFWHRWPCLIQLLEFPEDLETAIDKQNCVDVIFLDCKKVLYSTAHKIQRNIKGAEERMFWLGSWAPLRIDNKVCVKGENSGWRTVLSGIP